MTHIIAKAIVEAEDIRIQKENEKRKEKDRKWREVIGYKDYSDKKGVMRWVLRFINDCFILLRIPRIPKEKIETDWVSWSLLKVTMVMLFQFITYGFLLGSMLMLFATIIHLKNILYLGFAVPIFGLFGIFRIASIEVDKIEDRNYLISLFTAIVTVISVIIAIIVAMKGR